MYYIGVDLGTSAVKLLLMEGNGKIANIVSKEYPLYFPHPGWSEQKPEDWWEAVKCGLKELVAGYDASKVAGISFGGQMHGLVILDKDDQVIRPAILWNDGRTQEETDYLNNVIGKDKLSQYTANIAFTGFTAPKVLWVKNKEPENFARIAKIMLPKDYIAYKLSGSFCTDVSDASGMLLFDVAHKCWSKEMMEICGVKEEQLAKIYESFAHADGHYHLMGCMLSAAPCNKWWMEEILQTKEFAKEQAAITADKLGNNHVYFLPYLMGERSPHNDANARGTFIGMTMDTTRADMYQAVLEGVAYAIRDSFEVAKSLGIDIKRSKICGGGAKSPLWKQIFANVLNIKLDIIESEEGPGYGGAMLAAVACGEYASVEEAASRLVKIVDTVEPDAEIAARYEERYHKFTQIYPTVKELFPKIM